MFKRILVALDGSANAERCLSWAERLAGAEGAELVLFRAVPSIGATNGTRPAFVEAKNYVTAAGNRLEAAGFSCRAAARRGSAASAIVSAALKEGCDLVLMATRGGSRVKRWLLGGVTEQVLRLSPVPVLVIRSQLHASRKAQVGRIVVPVDGSRLGESLVPWLKRITRLLHARLFFLHVYPAGPRGLSRRRDEQFDALRKRMVHLVGELREEGIDARFRVDRGDAAQDIIARVGPSDLIAMTTQGRGGFKRWILGSVAEKVIHGARAPVFVYKSETQGLGGRSP